MPLSASITSSSSASSSSSLISFTTTIDNNNTHTRSPLLPFSIDGQQDQSRNHDHLHDQYCYALNAISKDSSNRSLFSAHLSTSLYSCQQSISSYTTTTNTHSSASTKGSLRSLTLLNPSKLNMSVEAPQPGSPPELSSSSTKSSSRQSSSAPAVEELNDISHFEDISLSDNTRHVAHPENTRPFKSRQLVRAQTQPIPRPAHSSQLKRDSSGLRTSVTLNNHVRNVKEQYSPRGAWQRSNSSGAHSASLPASSSRRGPSPIRQFRPSSTKLVGPLSARPRLEHIHSLPIPQVPSRHPGKRRTAAELEADLDDSDDELPEDAYISNVPTIPRPQHIRAQSNSPQGTPSRPKRNELIPKRAQSWDVAMSELSSDVQALTTALETYHDENLSSQNLTEPPLQKASTSPAQSPPMLNDKRLRPFILPPVQRSNIMIDPLPVSKEKEKHLTRTRPSWLPPKSQKEERRHVREYKQMMASFQEAEKKKSVLVDKSERTRAESDSGALDLWENIIIPDWHNKIRHARTREAWWRGIPPQARGRAWSKAIGNDLHLSPASYNAALTRAKATEKRLSEAIRPGIDDDDDESKMDRRARRSLAILDADIANSAYPSMGLFQQGQQYHEQLRNVLLAYAAYREDTGHVRGTAAVCALLLLHMMPVSSPGFASMLSPSTPNLLSRSPSPCPTSPDLNKENNAPSSRTSISSNTTPDSTSTKKQSDTPLITTFIALANLLNRPLSLAFCLGDPAAKEKYFRQLTRALDHKLPRLYQHLSRLITTTPSSTPTTNGFPSFPPKSPTTTSNNTLSPNLSTSASRKPPRPLSWPELLTPLCQSLLTHRLSPAESARLWDIMVFESDAAVVRGAVAVLARLESRLYGDVDEVRAVLSWRRMPPPGDNGGLRRGSANAGVPKSPFLSPCPSPRFDSNTSSGSGALPPPSPTPSHGGFGAGFDPGNQQRRGSWNGGGGDADASGLEYGLGGPEELGRWMKWAGKEERREVLP